MSTEFTYQDVAEHNTKKDCFLVVHDKVYDCSKFIDEHPGGEEVMLDVAGQDATEAFEDVGHSDEARETLEPMLVGTLKRQAGDPVPKTTTSNSPSKGGNTEASTTGIGAYAAIVVAGALAYFAYIYMQAQQAQQQQQ